MKYALRNFISELSLIAWTVSVVSLVGQTFPEWEITGTVVSESGPVRGAYVIVSGPTPMPTAVTDARGSYSMRGKVPGQYSVSVQQKDNISSPHPRFVNLTSGMRLRLDFKIPKGAVISGRLLDRDRQPVREFLVRAWSKITIDGQLRFVERGGDRTNDLGEYRIPYLPEGFYIVAATAKPVPLKRRDPEANHPPAEAYPPVTFYPGTRLVEAATVVELRSAEERQSIDIVLQKEPTRCIFFKVGAGFTGTRVGAGVQERLAIEGLYLGEARVAALGEYVMCGVPRGEYRILITSIAEGHRLQVLGHQMALVIVDTQNADAGLLEPLPRHDVQGTVTIKESSESQPMPTGIQVTVVPQELRALYASARPTPVRSDGAFVLRDLLPGEYGVRVHLPAGYYLLGAYQKGREVSKQGFHPANGDVRINLGADGCTVTGNVVGDDRTAVPDALVLLIPRESSRHLETQSDQNGAYRFRNVKPGKYRLVATTDLERSQWVDDALSAQLSAQGTDLDLGPRESRTVEARVRSVR